MAKVFAYGRQNLSDADIGAVVATLKGDWLTQGPKVREFEVALEERFGARYAAAVANGTAALHLCGLALGWKPGDIVITSPYTFLASTNCIVYAGATPDFVDINRKSYTIDVALLKAKIWQLERSGKKVRAVIGVDFAGNPCDWPALRRLADEHGFQLVADACHAIGATMANDAGYAAKYADLVVMSFHPVKHITTGEGGAVLTMSREYHESVKLLRSHGMTKEESALKKHEGPWYYEMHELGYNYRITDIQCALGLSQLKQLGAFLERRRAIAKLYDKEFDGDDRLVTPKARQACEHAYHLYPLLVRFPLLRKSKEAFFASLAERGIILQVHYIPVHWQPYYQRRYGFRQGDFPVAEEVYSMEVSIPMHPGLTDDDVQFIAREIRKALE